MRRENLSELHLLMDGFGVSWMVSPKSGSGLLVEGGKLEDGKLFTRGVVGRLIAGRGNWELGERDHCGCDEGSSSEVIPGWSDMFCGYVARSCGDVGPMTGAVQIPNDGVFEAMRGEDCVL